MNTTNDSLHIQKVLEMRDYGLIVWARLFDAIHLST